MARLLDGKYQLWNSAGVFYADLSRLCYGELVPRWNGCGSPPLPAGQLHISLVRRAVRVQHLGFWIQHFAVQRRPVRHECIDGASR